jgi:hypothetical protein
LADLQAERRLFDSEPFGCASEMQLLGNRYEIAEMPELHGPTTGVAGRHQLSGNGDGFVHSNRRKAGGSLAQDVSDLHRNLAQMGRSQKFLT